MHIVYTAQHQTNAWDTDTLPGQWWACVAYTGQHDALNQRWVNVGPQTVTLAHIQRGAKKKTRKPNTGLMLVQRLRRWPNISPALGQSLVLAGATSACTIEAAGRGHTEQTEVNQYVPYSVYRGGDIIKGKADFDISPPSHRTSLIVCHFNSIETTQFCSHLSALYKLPYLSYQALG